MADLWISCVTSIITHVNNPKVARDWMKVCETVWPNPMDSRTERMSECAAQPRPEDDHLASAILGRLIQGNHPDQQVCARSSKILKQRCWWYTWTDWHLVYRLLRISSLKEGTVLRTCSVRTGVCWSPSPTAISPACSEWVVSQLADYMCT
jgi:hypothetical protein